jgi:hypothetical protein
MINQLIVQGIGIVSLLFFVFSFQAKSRSNILYLHIFSMILYAIHFSLLAAWTAVAMVSLNAIKSYTFSFRENKKWIKGNFLLYLFLILFWILGILTWEGYHSLFVILALNFVTLSHWSKSTKKLKLIFMLSIPLWIAYDIYVGSYAGIIFEVVLLFSIVIGLWRFDKIKNI